MSLENLHDTAALLITVISHPNKVMLRILLNRLKSKTQELLAEEQADFIAKRSTTEQIFNLRLHKEKHLEHQHQLLHNFIDFKKAFDRVWHDGLWHVLRSGNFDEDLVQVIQSFYKTSTSAVLMGGQLGDFFPTSVGVRQGVSSRLSFSIFSWRTS